MSAVAFVAYWLGLTSASDAPYLFWSGVVGDVGLLGVVWSIVRKHNCHRPWCLRVGRFPDGQWTYCRRHHSLDNPGAVA